MTKNLTLGFFGFGCVGQGLYHVLDETHGIKATIKKICVKNPNKSRPIEANIFTFDKSDILDNPDIDVVVEMIDDAEASFEIVKTALERGKAVVTANKRMLAEHLEEIYTLQQLHGKPVLYEASVCGAIPILRNLEEYYDNDLITSIEGIFNGSTNYILTKVFEDRLNYAEALRQAQDLGFAESDPALDVKGFDAKFKLAIAITHTFGVFVKPHELINLGIDKISEVDLKFARENGYTIKLVVRAFKENGKVYGLVAPQFLESTNLLASVRNEFNAVIVQGAFSEKQLFVGKGAGGYPTGSAMLSDISALTYGYAYEYKKLKQRDSHSFSNDAVIEVMVSFRDKALVNPQDFEDFKGGYQGNGSQYMSGFVSLEKLREWSGKEGISVILTPQFNLLARAPLKQQAVVA
jgi:homoserine dehydrogenase